MGLSWAELLRLAVEMEEKGRAFYLALAGRAEDPEVRRTLEEMAAEEEDHAAVFARRLSGREVDLPEETHGYLEALLADLARRAPAELRDPGQGLALAVEMEKDSILFYTELAAAVEDEEARRILHEILRAEKLHLVEVRERLDEEG